MKKPFYTFHCPFPCKSEVTLKSGRRAKCSVCGKEFDEAEIEELMLSQGLFEEWWPEPA